jgi:hypothetical protein
MNDWLAKVYGTGSSQEDLEKIAQAEVAQQLAGQEGLDLSHLNEEQLAALGQEVLGGESGGAAQEGGHIDPSQLSPEVVEHAEQILANPSAYEPALVQEAQAIQQVIAHANGQSQSNMAKTAQERLKEAQEKFEEADFLGRVMAHSFNQEIEKIAKAKTEEEEKEEKKMMPQEKKEHEMMMGKHAAAINGAAEKLAAEILAANGIDPSTLQPAQQQGTTSGANAVNNLIEKRAHQILRQLGFAVES